MKACRAGATVDVTFSSDACPLQMVEFALAIQHVLSVFNEDLLNFDFVCKLGLNIGPVTAGVIGTTKLYYDIWGDTVNIASRMYSTGVLNRIQVLSSDMSCICYSWQNI